MSVYEGFEQLAIKTSFIPSCLHGITQTYAKYK